MMIRSMFVREEGHRLVVGSGLFEEWFETEGDICFGPTLTPWGPVSVRIVRPASERLLSVDAHWREDPPRVDVEVPGFEPVIDANCSSAIPLRRDELRMPARQAARSSTTEENRHATKSADKGEPRTAWDTSHSTSRERHH
jgi:hypothetical protein